MSSETWMFVLRRGLCDGFHDLFSFCGRNRSRFIVSSWPLYWDLCSPLGNCFVMLTLSHWTTPPALFFNQYCTNSWLTWGPLTTFSIKHLPAVMKSLCVPPHPNPPHPSGVSVVWSHCLNTSSVPCSLKHVIIIPVSLLVLKLEALPPFRGTPLTASVCTCMCVRLCVCVDSGL